VIVTIDAGNSRLSIATAKGGRVRRETVLARPVDRARVVRVFERLAQRGCDACVFATVVPSDARWLRAAWRRASGLPIYQFPRDFRGMLEIRPRPARRVGADRLANAAGAIRLARQGAGARSSKLRKTTHAIVADAGTAVTVDVVSLRGVFEGGSIAPGPRLGALALAGFTAQLPHVTFRRCDDPVGRSTRRAIAAGLWIGFRGLVRALVEAARARFPRSVVFVAGGDGRACLRNSGIDAIDRPDLTHLGLAEAYDWRMRRRGGRP
jgi:type III pantothenate kinase